MGGSNRVRRWRVAWSGSLLAGVISAVGIVVPVTGQQLPLKRALPDPSPGGCVGFPAFAPVPPTTADAQEAARLAGAATQAAILGDQAGARDFLERAAGLDPTDEGIAYELARTLEALGDVTPAIQAYCRYLALSPDGADAAEVRERVMELNPPDEPRSPQAQLAFARGVDAFERADMREATRQFTQALTAEPDLGPAYYNRALAYGAQRRYEIAIEDLRRYLDLTPEAADGPGVLEQIGTLRSPPVVYNPTTALVAGMVVPGFGQFHTDRPVGGLVVLSAAAAAAGIGMLYTETEVRCATPGDPCPPNQIIDESTTRPYLAPGLVTAAVITIGAAIEGYISAKNKNADAPGLVGTRRPAQSGLAFLRPTVEPGRHGAVDVHLIRVGF